MSLLSPSLEAFWAVVRKGTVQDASSILGLTQTGVTQRIRSLEKQLKTTLFTRSRKGMKLTAEGEALLQYVKSSLDIEGVALSKIQKTARVSLIDVGITGSSSLLRSRVIPHLIPLQKTFPLLRLRFDFSDFTGKVDKLKAGLATFALLEPHQVTREMDSKIIKAERYCLYGPASWKRRFLKDILKTEKIVDFDESDLMTVNFLNKYKLKAGGTNERHFANNTEALATIIQQGLAYSVLSEEFAKAVAKSNELINLAPGCFLEKKVALAWAQRHESPDYFQAIIKAIN